MFDHWLQCNLNKTEDVVNRPKHYTSHPSGIEIIELTRHMPFSLGNAFKYVARASHKHDSPLVDLKKAQWYIDDYAKHCKERHPVRNITWNRKELEENWEKFMEHEDCKVLPLIFLIAFTNADDSIGQLQLAMHQLLRSHV